MDTPHRPNQNHLLAGLPMAEFEHTYGIDALLQEKKLLAYRFSGTRYDFCSILGYLKAQIAFV